MGIRYVQWQTAISKPLIAVIHPLPLDWCGPDANLVPIDDIGRELLHPLSLPFDPQAEIAAKSAFVISIQTGCIAHSTISADICRKLDGDTSAQFKRSAFFVVMEPSLN